MCVLLLKFFEFYLKFPYSTHIITIRPGRALSHQEFKESPKFHQRFPIKSLNQVFSKRWHQHYQFSWSFWCKSLHRHTIRSAVTLLAISLSHSLLILKIFHLISTFGHWPYKRFGWWNSNATAQHLEYWTPIICTDTIGTSVQALANYLTFKLLTNDLHT